MFMLILSHIKFKNKNVSFSFCASQFSFGFHSIAIIILVKSFKMDSLFTSERILLSSDNCNKLIAGGILVDHESGRIKRIFTSQQEINSWLFIEHGGEVNFSKQTEV
jgi:5-keto 4-deoxyuronate isomerase